MFHFPSLICVDYHENSFFLSISIDRNVYSFGNCSDGSNCCNQEYLAIPTLINGLTDIKMISCGCSHSLCLDFIGNCFSFGSNYNNKLGIKDYHQSYSHIPLKLDLPPITQISCGYDFSLCLSEDGYVYSFGDNSYKQLGYEKSYKLPSPQQIPELNNIELIECGGESSICKSFNNICYAWGSNDYGQLGDDNKSRKIRMFSDWPDNIISIKCGYDHSLLLTLEGQVYSFGNNECGESGINDKNIISINIPTLIKDIPEIQRIECGYDHSMCIDINNNLWLFGFNSNGVLGLGDKENRYKPIIHPTLSDIIDISSGGEHTFVKTIDNKIYAFGSSICDKDMFTNISNREIPIQVFIDNEDIWCSTIRKSRAKSARK